jgi:hypothetical protein
MRTLVILLLSLIPGVTYAAQGSIFIAPATGSFFVGDTATIEVYASTDGTAVTAAEAELQFNPAVLEVVALSTAGSALKLWSEEPTFSAEEGRIRFSGSADSAFTRNNALLMSAVVRFKAAGEQRIQITSGALLANDGKGSNIIATLGSGVFTTSVRTATESETGGLVLGASTQGDDVPPLPPTLTVSPADDTTPLIIRGTAEPLSRVELWVQLESGDPVRYSAPVGADGTFVFASNEPLEAGDYRVYGVTYGQFGLVSAHSETYAFQIPQTGIQPYLTAALGFTSLPSTATALVLVFGFILGYAGFFWYGRRFESR